MLEPRATASPSFLAELRQQRWDDHRLYHQSRVNQTLHLFSACCFLTAYVLIPFQPIAAALLGWVVAMWSRQIGHFFFEPRGYDAINHATFAHKEAVKVGYNLQRKLILLGVWLLVPVVLWTRPGWLGLAPAADRGEYLDQLGQMWLLLAAAGLVARTAWLWGTRGAQTGLVWLTKILTDPFHDIMLYREAPLRLMRGERFDPILHARR